ncbi:MAG: hypothetical protein IJF33_06785 [Clostridia bacterium]|nr:hypothetical protein [Clostridia bacterium]
MAKVQVGIIVYRDEKGNFLPETQPIYRELPDVPNTPDEYLCLGDVPLSPQAERDVYKLFADKFRAHRRAMQARSNTSKCGGDV